MKPEKIFQGYKKYFIFFDRFRIMLNSINRFWVFLSIIFFGNVGNLWQLNIRLRVFKYEIRNPDKKQTALRENDKHDYELEFQFTSIYWKICMVAMCKILHD